jgi:hypothetical protein
MIIWSHVGAAQEDHDEQYLWIMPRKAILITPKDKAEERLLLDLIERMGLNGRSLNEAEMEDLGLSILLSKVDRSKKADKERVMRKLRV